MGTVGTYTIANAKNAIFEPIKLEQLKIGGFFNKIDNLIKLQVHKVEIIKQRKQGLLQKYLCNSYNYLFCIVKI
ncbi:hypothetical protein ACVPOY_13330 [Staphylococcus aureus]